MCESPTTYELRLWATYTHINFVTLSMFFSKSHISILYIIIYGIILYFLLNNINDLESYTTKYTLLYLIPIQFNNIYYLNLISYDYYTTVYFIRITFEILRTKHCEFRCVKCNGIIKIYYNYIYYMYKIIIIIWLFTKKM